MMSAADYLDTPRERLFRWGAAFLCMFGLSVAGAALLFLAWPAALPREQTGGAILIEMTEMAIESPSEGDNAADAPELAGIAAQIPPDPQVDPVPEEPLEPVLEEKVEPPPEEQPEAVAEDVPPVEETPPVPEPDVVLPEKQEEVTEPAEKPPEKPAEKAADKPRPKPSPRQQQQQAAAAPQGKTNPASATASPANAAGFNPNPVVRTQPVYPAGARSRRQEGHVVVSYSVSPEGSVTGVRVVSASPPGIFESATLAAVRKWRFRASANGASHRLSTIRFKLK